MAHRRTFLSVLAAAAALGAAGCSLPATAAGNVVDMQVVDRSDGNSQLQTWQYRGSNWIAGKPGDRYSVRLTNRTGARVLVVLSVDGVNAISGETAGVGQRGYVLAPYESTEISGWRKTLEDTAAFYFTSLSDSYAARTDRPDNVGVIGAAVFRERVVYRSPITRDVERRPFGRAQPDASDTLARNDPESPAAREKSADAAGAADSRGDSRSESRAAPPSYAPPVAAPSLVSPATASPAPSVQQQDAAKSFAKREDRLGTGHGERVYSPITLVDFERASERPDEVVKLRYDSYQNLVASGVVPPRRPRAVTPDPFPAFAPDPHG